VDEKIAVENWGLIDFEEAWERQKQIAESVRQQKTIGTLVFCEHPSVITLGRNTQSESVLASPFQLSEQHIKVIPINRGGEATVHNPGQIVGYPIFNLSLLRPDLHWFLRTIEQSVIEVLSGFNIAAETVKGLTGVWVAEKKICAIGIHCSRWITQHGFALNVNNDLLEFENIIPCGIEDKGITSMKWEIGHTVTIASVVEHLSQKITENFLSVTKS